LPRSVLLSRSPPRRRPGPPAAGRAGRRSAAPPGVPGSSGTAAGEAPGDVIQRRRGGQPTGRQHAGDLAVTGRGPAPARNGGVHDLRHPKSPQVVRGDQQRPDVAAGVGRRPVEAGQPGDELPQLAAGLQLTGADEVRWSHSLSVRAKALPSWACPAAASGVPAVACWRTAAGIGSHCRAGLNRAIGSRFGVAVQAGSDPHGCAPRRSCFPCAGEPVALRGRPRIPEMYAPHPFPRGSENTAIAATPPPSVASRRSGRRPAVPEVRRHRHVIDMIVGPYLLSLFAGQSGA
jgi:hypothetical protein